MPELLIIIGLPSAIAIMATTFVVAMGTLGQVEPSGSVRYRVD
jgi:hypothetical protein